MNTKRHDNFIKLKSKNNKIRRSSGLSASAPSSTNQKYHVEMLDELFDISHCKCFQQLTSVNLIPSIECKCTSKLPASSITFYIDQRTTRQLFISSWLQADDTVNKRLATNLPTVSISDSEITNCCDLNGSAIDTSHNESACSNQTTKTDISSIFSDDIDADPNYEPSSKEHSAFNSEHISKIDLTDVALICDAKQVSTYAAASIVSATLAAHAKANRKPELAQSFAPVVTPTRLRRALNRTREKIVNHNNKKASNMYSFQFDGKLCNTLVTNDADAGKRNEIKKIEYIVVVKQPEDVFVASIPVTSSGADEIFNCMKDYFIKNKISLNNVVAIGCDGAPVNTGVANGIIRRFEELLGRPVQWIICILHLNELIFHRLFKFLDKSSCSPQSYSSELGNQLLKCEECKPVKFKRIVLDIHRLPANIQDWNLTSDQKYLLEIAKAVNAGNLKEQLANKKPGTMHKARWITTMSRILRTYRNIEKSFGRGLYTCAIYNEGLYSSAPCNKRTAVFCERQPTLIFNNFFEQRTF